MPLDRRPLAPGRSAASRFAVAFATLAAVASAQSEAPKVPIAHADLPAQVARLAPPADAWRDWVRGHDAAIRARVARGDEDSLVNLWLFGTSFTNLPPARPRDVDALGNGATLAQVAERRLDDLMTALARPTNDRLRWAAAFFDARQMGRGQIRDFLMGVSTRMLSETAEHDRVLQAPNTESDPLAWMARYASLYRDRGLSSDTSLLSSFAVDSALGALSNSGLLPANAIRRVAIVGPGLDFINKSDGHDFYPEQTIQPFAVVDSLLRHGLAETGRLAVTTFDVSGRVNGHIAAARDRAGRGEPYVLQLPLGDAERWSAGLLAYWERMGGLIGTAARPAAVPRSAGRVRVRALRVPPEVVLSIVPRDVNVVLERLDLPEAERFDLVVATNVFVYYDAREQALALVNIGRMLRPGGSLLSNQAIQPVPPIRSAVGHEAVVYSDRQFDHLFWYRRGDP